MMMNTSLTSRFLDARTREIALTLVGFLLLFASAQISIPLQPVPITLQTVAVMLIGLTFSLRAGVYSVALYLGAAAMGLPVLSNWSFGVLRLVGPAGGYLFGFLAAVVVMNTFRRIFTSQSFVTTFANCLLGTSVIFLFGIAWLARFVGVNEAITLGLMPFIIPGAIKALILCGAIRALR